MKISSKSCKYVKIKIAKIFNHAVLLRAEKLVHFKGVKFTKILLGFDSTLTYTLGNLRLVQTYVIGMHLHSRVVQFIMHAKIPGS